MNSVIFLGTPAFGATVLEGLIKAGYDIKAVVTQPDKKVGRKQKIVYSPVKELALKYALPLYQPVRLSKSDDLNALMAIQPDFLITAAFGQFLPTRFLKTAKIAAVNVHGSLLPKYRGGAPIQYAVRNGDAETGVTIMEMVKEMDAGDMYAQAKLPIGPDETSGEVFEKLAPLGRDLLLETLPKIASGEIVKKPQDPSQVVFSPTIEKSEERIPLTLTAQEAKNLIRALNPDPGAYLVVQGKRLKVWAAEVAEDNTSLLAGCLVSNQGRFAISFADSTVLNLTEVQPVGKKAMKVKDFLNGQGKKFNAGDQIVDED
ncbi:Methionyl-tRNA formyltransferase [Lactobacillus equicursoris DSM 19284 = JCM 14600 = CIP 110162]|uniref:Methionyl-tRNA formyltransferase n=1 Tax=Lactobacillus equicursoris DSM 19284 = JCM 14600 = CIP 110162 TaxID=1293597 RepID=K0NRW3_9LACO|nr:methionyl-tRNA formyltransferase [Lactobacillus equicursoris]KRL03727.1 methionyl-trna formyltransferase [Lactobacillus equicursoris DSM 19284 = JCM 14600 = CIP 110162]CCK84859.1 Methionyl-tRNA formyltransferase [Lactobacillus equicursoris DSM 19284 = JCM 14600 = CIP 110162]